MGWLRVDSSLLTAAYITFRKCRKARQTAMTIFTPIKRPRYAGFRRCATLDMVMTYEESAISLTIYALRQRTA